MGKRPGEFYMDARERTFKLFRDAGRPMDETEMEASPGNGILIHCQIIENILISYLY